MPSDRRAFLRAGAGGLGLAVTAGARRVLGGDEVVPLPDPYPRLEPVTKVSAPTEYKILEIFLLGGLSPWETFYIRGDGGEWADWRGGRSEFDSLSGPADWPAGENLWFGQDSAGHDVFLGRPAGPLWLHRHRMRVLVMRSPLEDDVPHEVAVPLGLTGRQFGDLRAAGLGAAIQREWLERGADPIIPVSYVLAPAAVPEGYLDAATSAGRYGADARPLALRIPGIAEKTGSATLAEMLARSAVTGRAGRDELLRHYERRYRDALTWAGAPTRCEAMTAYSSSLHRLLGAGRFAALVGNPVAPAATPSFTPGSRGAVPGAMGAHATTEVALGLAARLLGPAGPARHVTVLDGGFGNAGYDGHQDLALLTCNGLFPTLRALDGLIASRALDLNSTLVLLNTEFGRTPSDPRRPLRPDELPRPTGRDHHLAGYVTVMLGGPVNHPGGSTVKTSREVSVLQGRVIGTFDASGNAGNREVFSPADVIGATILAAGGDPLRPEAFGPGDFGATVAQPPGTVRENLRQHVFGLATLLSFCFVLGQLGACNRVGSSEIVQRGLESTDSAGDPGTPDPGIGSVADEPLPTADTGDDGSPWTIDHRRIPRRDAGDVSFVRQALPKLLGRRALGWDEVKLMTDIITAAGPAGRGPLVQALMNEEAFARHWEGPVKDWLRIERVEEDADAGCYGTGAATAGPTLARTIRDSDPATIATAAAGRTMSDVIRSALALDDLAPAYRASLVTRTWLASVTDAEVRRAADTRKFLRTYVNRDLACLGCHNSDESRSGFMLVGDSGWNRTHPTAGGTERALFGVASGRPVSQIFSFFRDDYAINSPSWGLSQCQGYSEPTSDDNRNGGYPASFGNALVPLPGQPASNPLRASPIHLAASLRRGVARLAAEGLRAGAASAACEACDRCVRREVPGPGYEALKQRVRDQLRLDHITPALPAMNGRPAQDERRWSCVGCHQGGDHPFGSYSAEPADAWDLRMIADHLVVPRDLENSHLLNKVTSREMPPRPEIMSDPARMALISALQDWIMALPLPTGPPSAECVACDRLCDRDMTTRVDADAAFAYLVAEHITDQTYQEIFGAQLTVANYFPRNSAQSSVLKDLNERSLLRAGSGAFSLKRLIARLVQSPLFNRLPPGNTPVNPYELPMVFDPWVERDPRDPSAPVLPQNTHNAVGDGVHRHRPRTLVSVLGNALGWSIPDRTPSPGAPVDGDGLAILRSLGQYMGDDSPGFADVDLQGLARWEHHHGVCESRASGGSDWIGGLAARVAAIGGGPGAPTYRDLAAVLKDRLLSDPVIEASEAPRVAGLFGVPDLDGSLPADAAVVDASARVLCGVLVETPQYMLAGLAQRQLGSRPSLSPADAYRNRCLALVPAFRPQGWSLVCHNDTVELQPLVQDPAAVQVFDPSLLYTPASGP